MHEFGHKVSSGCQGEAGGCSHLSMASGERDAFTPCATRGRQHLFQTACRRWFCASYLTRGNYAVQGMPVSRRRSGEIGVGEQHLGLVAEARRTLVTCRRGVQPYEFSTLPCPPAEGSVRCKNGLHVTHPVPMSMGKDIAPSLVGACRLVVPDRKCVGDAAFPLPAGFQPSKQLRRQASYLSV